MANLFKNKILSAYWYHIALCVVLAIVALVRIKLLAMPFERDEGEYAYIGKLILHGGVPYRDACNMKLPGTYCMYSIIIALFGSSPTGIHLGLMLTSISTLVILYFAFKKLFGPSIALSAIAIYSLLSISPIFYGFAAHATHFVNLFVALGLLFCARFNESNTRQFAFLTGLMFGFAFLMKQQAVFYIPFAMVMVAITTEPRFFKKIAANTTLCVLGTVLPYLLVVIIMLAAGAFGKFWFWTVQYANAYTSIVKNWNDILYYFNGTFHWMFSEFKAVWLLFIAGLPVVVFSRKFDLKQKLFVILFTILSIATVCPGFYFRPHYFVTILPATGLLVAIALDFFADLISKRKVLPVLNALPFIMVCLIWANEFRFNKNYYFFEENWLISKQGYVNCPFVEAPEIAGYIATHSKAEDKVALLVSEPEIYVYANRRAATRYLYMSPLLETQKYNVQMQNELKADVETSKPEFIVYSAAVWLMQPDVPHIISDWIAPYISANYEKAGWMVLSNAGPSKFYWGEEAKHYQGNDKDYGVYKRKPEAIKP